MSSEDSSCLVARAVPCAVPAAPAIDLEKDILSESFKKLTVNAGENVKKSDMSPADFVNLQNMRSSALARKTNTSTKFSSDNETLFDDLLETTQKLDSMNFGQKLKGIMAKKKAKKAEVKVEKEKEEKTGEKKETEKKEEKAKSDNDKDKSEDKKDSEEKKYSEEKKDSEESELLARGPVRTSRPNFNFHPYSNGSNYSYDNSPSNLLPCQSQYNESWAYQNSSKSSSPDTFVSDLGYSSNSPPFHEFKKSDIKQFLISDADGTELPDALSDFILKYSRRYTNSPPPATKSDAEAISPTEFNPKIDSVDSAICDSPMSAVSVSHSSPAGPHGGMSGPSTPNSAYRVGQSKYRLRSQLPSTRYAAYVGKKSPTEPVHRPAKDVLRALIAEGQSDALDEAWAWTCKCQQYYPGALCYQDADKDTLLHIVTQHMDLPKVYALVEQMLKSEYSSHDKPFDVKNRDGITALFLAVEKRHNIVVDYLLEAGSDPNTQNTRYERDAPLHYAAARNMVEIVKTICSYGTTDLNMSNGMGLTPLLCAIKNHGVIDEENKVVIDNSEVIQALLKYGADPMISVSWLDINLGIVVGDV